MSSASPTCWGLELVTEEVGPVAPATLLGFYPGYIYGDVGLGGMSGRGMCQNGLACSLEQELGPEMLERALQNTFTLLIFNQL